MLLSTFNDFVSCLIGIITTIHFMNIPLDDDELSRAIPLGIALIILLNAAVFVEIHFLAWLSLKGYGSARFIRYLVIFAAMSSVCGIIVGNEQARQELAQAQAQQVSRVSISCLSTTDRCRCMAGTGRLESDEAGISAKRESR